MHLNHYMLLCFCGLSSTLFPELTLLRINQKKKEKKETMETVVTQKELTLDNEIDFKMCACTQT